MWIVAPQNYLGLFRNIGPWGPIKAMESMESSPQEKASGICIFKSPLFCQVQYSCTYHTMGWLRLFSDVLEPSMIFSFIYPGSSTWWWWFLSSPEDMLIDFRERGREGGGEREKCQCEREHWSVVSHQTKVWTHNPGMYPDQESNLQPISLWADAPTNWATVARAHLIILITNEKLQET